jgi:hypothetical protein
MTIRQLPGIGLVTFLAAAMPAAAIAQTTPPQTPPPAQEKPADPKALASIAGKWDMSAETPNGTTAVTLVIKLDGKKVTGTMTGPQGEMPHEGEFVDGKLTTAITIQGNGGQMNITFSGAMKEDGTLAGTFDFGQGAMTWKATRAKN